MMEGYAAYKDSGVDWLGEIPAGWEKQQVKRLFEIGRGRVISKEELDENGKFPVYSSQTKNNGILGYISTYDFDASQITWTTDGANAGTVFLRSGKYNCTNVCGTLKPNSDRANLAFCAYTLGVATLFYKRPDTNGAKIMNEEMAVIEFPLPPLPEQTAIAGFLDEKTAKINELVGIKRRQIALLGERKQILIQNAVTKGLNPNAPLKDSGVDWIGNIPAHWEVKPAKHLFIEVDERSENGEEELLSVSHMTGVTPRSEKTVSMFLAEDYSGSKICKKDDLVFNIMWAWMGALGVSPLVGIVSPSYAVFRQLKAQTFNPVYLEMLMQSLGYVEHYNKVSTGLHSSRLRFYSHMFLSMKIGYPSFDEQEQIIEFLNRETGKITKAVSVLENQITKLNEYKTTLINAAVTGKIKVA